MLLHEKLKTLQSIISSVISMWKQHLIYQVTLFVFFLIHVCFQIKYQRTLRNFYKNKLTYRVHLLSLISVIMNLKSPTNSSVLNINYARSEKLLSCLVYIDQLHSHHFITEGVGFSCLIYIFF